MTWALFVLGAIVSWGIYGSALHNGQLLLGNGFRALMCVGIAYVVIAILIPTITLSSQGQLNGFTANGTLWALVAGALGAAGGCLYHLLIQNGRPSNLRHAACLLRCAVGKRSGNDDPPSTTAIAEPHALSWLPGHRSRYDDSPLLQTTGVAEDNRFITATPQGLCCNSTLSVPWHPSRHFFALGPTFSCQQGQGEKAYWRAISR